MTTSLALNATAPQILVTQEQLATRWGRSVAAIRLASAVGVGPRYVKLDGALHYPLDEIRRYEQQSLLQRCNPHP